MRKKLTRTVTVEVEADVTVTFDIDRNYGADADGNRGTRAVFVNDVRLNNLKEVEEQILEQAPDLVDETGEEDGAPDPDRGRDD